MITAAAPSDKPKTPKLKAFQGSYNKDTQKLVNIEGKTFVAPKSYEKPKSKTNPSFKRVFTRTNTHIC